MDDQKTLPSDKMGKLKQQPHNHPDEQFLVPSNRDYRPAWIIRAKARPSNYTCRAKVALSRLAYDKQGTMTSGRHDPLELALTTTAFRRELSVPISHLNSLHATMRISCNTGNEEPFRMAMTRAGTLLRLAETRLEQLCHKQHVSNSTRAFVGG